MNAQNLNVGLCETKSYNACVKLFFINIYYLMSVTTRIR